MKRINHFAWLVRRENVATYTTRLESLLGTGFEQISNDVFDAYVNWDSGLELLTPADATSDRIDTLTRTLDERGEAPYALVIRVPDLDAGSAHASSNGFDVAPESTPADPAQRLEVIRSYTNKLNDIRETHIGEFLGLKLALCEISYVDEDERFPGSCLVNPQPHKRVGAQLP